MSQTKGRSQPPGKKNHGTKGRPQQSSKAAAKRASHQSSIQALQRAQQAPDSLLPSEAEELQQTIGNRALGALSGQSPPDENGNTTDARHSLKAIQRHSAAVLQRALTHTLPQVSSENSGAVQRQEKEQIMAKPDGDSELQRDSLGTDPAASAAGGQTAPGTEEAIRKARSGGATMSDDVRQPMEQVFGTDFSGVKIHHDGESDALNRSLQARAFTVGNDVFFSQGAYNPTSSNGQKLLAHELTHVVQQNGTASSPQTKLIVSHANDSQEREADEVAQMVGQFGPQLRNNGRNVPLQTKLDNLKSAQGQVQRGFGGKVALAVGKGFLMSFVQAVAGPLMLISKSQRASTARRWKSYNDDDVYTSVHLTRMGKASMVFQQIGMLAGWVSMLTGVGALIAAAFAPAGLAASALLGSISGIAGLVAAGAGVVTFGLSLILMIADIRRALALPKSSLRRKKAIIAAIGDGMAAFSGLLAAVGGVVGAAMGGWNPLQSASDVSASLASGGMTGLGMELAKGAAAGQAFAISDEIGGEVSGVITDEQKERLRQDPRYNPFQQGKEAMQKRKEILNKAPLHLYRQTEDDAGQEEDASPQVLGELAKVESAIADAKDARTRDQAGMEGEQADVATVGPDLDKAKSGVDQARGIDDVESNLKQIEQQSEEGEQKAEDEQEAEDAGPASKSDAEAKMDKLEQADASIDQIESKSGEALGKKQSFFGKLKSKISGFFRSAKRKAKKFGKLLLSGFMHIKARLKAIFAKIKAKVIQILIKVTGLKEPLDAIEAEVKDAQTAIPESEEAAQEAKEGFVAQDAQQEQLETSIAEAKETLRQ